MRTELELQQDVASELGWDPLTRGSEIAITVKGSVATLGGTVNSYPAKYAALRAAERVRGIRSVADDIMVKPQDSTVRSDTEIAHQVVNALRWDVLVPDDKIQSRVQEGWITLDGEVDWEHQRRAAFKAVRNLTGVRGVTNLLTLKPRVAEKDVTTLIKAALHRRAESEAKHIDVETADGVVTLKGSVHSWGQRIDAENAAWAAPGVRKVNDLLVVSP